MCRLLKKSRTGLELYPSTSKREVWWVEYNRQWLLRERKSTSLDISDSRNQKETNNIIGSGRRLHCITSCSLVWIILVISDWDVTGGMAGCCRARHWVWKEPPCKKALSEPTRWRQIWKIEILCCGKTFVDDQEESLQTSILNVFSMNHVRSPCRGWQRFRLHKQPRWMWNGY